LGMGRVETGSSKATTRLLLYDRYLFLDYLILILEEESRFRSPDR
jgi:hypothetical protein